MLESPQSREQSKHNLALEVLRSTGSLRLVAFGYSMLPALWPGDLLAVKAQPLESIRAGDVVLYERHGRFFIHRTLGRMNSSPATSLLVRGDAMPAADAPVAAGELLGKIVSVERGSRSVPVPACSLLRRCVGLILAYSARLRSLALRWHAWRTPAQRSPAEFTSEPVSLT